MASDTASANGDAKLPASIAVLLGLVGLPVAVFALDALGASPPAPWGAVFKLAVGGVVVAVVWHERRSWAALGVRRPTRWDLLWVVGVFSLGLAGFALTAPLVEALGLTVQEGALLAGNSVGVAIFAAVVAGLVEEPLFRGVPIESLARTDLGLLRAGGVTWLLFTVAHAPSYPAGNLLQTAVVAAVFTAAYLWRRSIVPLVIAHVALNVSGVLAASYA